MIAYVADMTKQKRKVNTVLFNDKLNELGRFAVEQACVGAQVCCAYVRAARKGKEIPAYSQEALARFFKIKKDVLFPVVKSRKKAV